MNGFIKKTLAALSLAGMSCFVGCNIPTVQEKYYDCVDPCWPQRYDTMASDSVSAAFGAQVENGHILEQTVWNSHFERGTQVLTPAGQAHLADLSHRPPHADPHIYLETAYDTPVPYNPADPAKYAIDRAWLDSERKKAILDFLNAQMAGRFVPFEVIIHDPHDVGMHSVPMIRSINEFHNSFKGFLPLGGGGGAVSGGSIAR
jgi:hypothetical protein